MRDSTIARFCAFIILHLAAQKWNASGNEGFFTEINITHRHAIPNRSMIPSYSNIYIIKFDVIEWNVYKL